MTAQIKAAQLSIAHTQFIEMATGGVARDLPVLPTPELCEFLHSPCWLYPVTRFFAHAIDGEFELGHPLF